MMPARHLPSIEARRRFGDRVDRLGSLFLEADPLADEAWAALRTLPPAEFEAFVARAHLGPPRGAPAPVRALCEQLSHIPFWVDLERCDRGGRALLGRGPLSGHVLALGSLIRLFCSPSGNKPLLASGELKEETVRRTFRTARYLQLACAPGGMRPGAPGFLATVRVRLLNAQIRARLLTDGRWRTELHGVPLNQPDMAGTLLLFSLYLAEGLRKVGAPLSTAETEDLLHLWRWIGWVLGVREELLCASIQEARELWALIELTQGFPDDDSRRLARALIENLFGTSGRGAAPWYALSAELVGEGLAQHLGYPKTRWRHVLPAMRSLVRPASGLLWRMPGLERFSHELGAAYWQRSVGEGFDPPAPVLEASRPRVTA